MEQRLAEEHHLGQLISTLEEQLDVDTVAFDQQLATLKKAVTDHNRREETHEFPALSDIRDTQTLIRLRRIVSQVPAVASGVAGTKPFLAQADRHRQRFRGTADTGQI